MYHVHQPRVTFARTNDQQPILDLQHNENADKVELLEKCMQMADKYLEVRQLGRIVFMLLLLLVSYFTSPFPLSLHLW